VRSHVPARNAASCRNHMCVTTLAGVMKESTGFGGAYERESLTRRVVERRPQEMHVFESSPIPAIPLFTVSLVHLANLHLDLKAGQRSASSPDSSNEGRRNLCFPHPVRQTGVHEALRVCLHLQNASRKVEEERQLVALEDLPVGHALLARRHPERVPHCHQLRQETQRA